MRENTPKEIQWEALIYGEWRRVSREYILFHIIGTKELQTYRQVRETVQS